MAEIGGDKPLGNKPLDDASEAAHEAAARETTPAPVQRRRSTRFELTLLALIAAFSVLTVLVTTTSTQGADLLVTRGLQSVSNPVFAALINAISWPGFTPQSFVVVAVILLALYWFGLRWEAASALIAAALEESVDLIIKDAVRRTRPEVSLVHVFTKLNSYSFPSGHVTFYTAFFGFLWYLSFTLLKPSWKRTLLLVIFGALILLVGASRIYLGEHWASDVLGGYLLGSLALMASIQIYRWGKARAVVPQPVAAEKERG
jgi:membrane-associated phospholipid phosphatase